MTAIANLMSLPWLGFTITIPDDADWIEGIAYQVSSTDTTPVPLDGILLEMTARKSLGDPSVLFYATTTNGLIQILPAILGSGVNSVWAVALYVSQFPTFLPVGSYVFGLQGLVGSYTRTLGSGPLNVIRGAS